MTRYIMGDSLYEKSGASGFVVGGGENSIQAHFDGYRGAIDAHYENSYPANAVLVGCLCEESVAAFTDLIPDSRCTILDLENHGYDTHGSDWVIGDILNIDESLVGTFDLVITNFLLKDLQSPGLEISIEVVKTAIINLITLLSQGGMLVMVGDETFKVGGVQTKNIVASICEENGLRFEISNALRKGKEIDIWAYQIVVYR